MDSARARAESALGIEEGLLLLLARGGEQTHGPVTRGSRFGGRTPLLWFRYRVVSDRARWLDPIPFLGPAVPVKKYVLATLLRS